MSKKLISALSRLLFSIQLSLSFISDEIKGDTCEENRRQVQQMYVFILQCKQSEETQ